jgi:hypothetical protein
MREVITARIIIPVAIPTILLLIDGLSTRLNSWKIRSCAGSRANLSAAWSATAVANSALSGCRISPHHQPAALPSAGLIEDWEPALASRPATLSTTSILKIREQRLAREIGHLQL